MKTPIDTVKGRIIDVDEHGVMTIKARYDDWHTLTKRQYSECLIQMIDGRPLSDKQRNCVYALLKEISKFTGQGISSTKEAMKRKFLDEDMCQVGMEAFSLSDAPVSLICAFQRYLVRFILDYDIPCSFPLLDFVDDVQDYVYACATRRKCCVCGNAAEPHHWDRIGMGRDREEVNQLGMRMEPLCRIHHTECHTMPQVEFDAKHHIVPVEIDKDLIEIWRLNGGN